MLDFDVIIIGGGPAGSAAGITLQKRGYSTCILDKASFPRTKLCGGVLTQKTLDLFSKYFPGIDPADFILKKTHSITFYFKGREINTCGMNVDFNFVERKTFDAVLLQEYCKSGGKVIENERIVPEKIDWDNNTVTTATSTYHYRFLIGADGCNSVLTRKAGIKRYDFFCVEGIVDKIPQEDEKIQIYFGVSRKGYGWYFPKTKDSIIGVIGDNSDKSVLKRANNFFADCGFNEVVEVKGAFIPSGKLFSFDKLRNNTLVIGDAAGFTDPVSGEGIYYAILSGILAAEAIDETIRTGNREALACYSEKIKSLKKELSRACLLRKVLYSPLVLAPFMKHLEKHRSFVLFYLERVVSTYEFNYRNFIRYYFGKYKKSLKRKRLPSGKER